MWFSKHSVCKECGVHFEPHKDKNNGYLNLCQPHRTPKVELERRILRAMEWAKRHWEECEVRAIAENEAVTAASYHLSQANIKAMAGMQADMQQTWPYGGLAGFGADQFQKKFDGRENER